MFAIGGDGDDSPAGASGEASAEQSAEGTESFLQQSTNMQQVADIRTPPGIAI